MPRQEKMTIEKANTVDHEVLTGITKRSKAYWGYSEKQIETWSELLTITQTYIETREVYKLLIDEKMVGYYAFYVDDDGVAKLDNLFILPAYIGKGHGRALMNHFFYTLLQTRVKRVLVDSEPHAENFYAKFGFVTIGQKETSIKNRFLPIMELFLNKAEPNK